MARRVTQQEFDNDVLVVYDTIKNNLGNDGIFTGDYMLRNALRAGSDRVARAVSTLVAQGKIEHVLKPDGSQRLNHKKYRLSSADHTALREGQHREAIIAAAQEVHRLSSTKTQTATPKESALTGLAGVNRVMLFGVVGKEPEFNHVEGVQAKFKLSLATYETYRNNAGDRQDRTEWHNVVIWGEKAISANSCKVRAGDLALIEGRIQTRSYDDKDGAKKYITEIVAHAFLFIPSP